MESTHRLLLRRFLLILLVLPLAFTACRRTTPAQVTPNGSRTPTATFSPTPSPVLVLTRTPRPVRTQAIWENFPAPRLTPVTPIPPPLTGLSIPEEVQSVVLAGIDREEPYSGRTDAIALLIYHPRLSRASLVSVPPDLFGYIPGYTMQRMNTAYAVGGAEQLVSAVEYNLGVRPNAYVILNLDDFTRLIDDLGGINVTVLENVRRECPGIIPGEVLLDGQKALCYMRLRYGSDETSRNRRQQEVLRRVLLRLVEGGNLIRLPELYDRYRSVIDSDLTREQVLGAWRLGLNLGDTSRTGQFQMGSDELTTWEISQHPPASVFLPNRPAVMKFMQEAVDFVTTPSPIRDVVVTLEYELTVSHTPTNTFTVTPTPTFTSTPTVTLTFTPTITRTPSPTFTRTITPTRTNSPTPRTPTPSVTPSPVTPSPSFTYTVAPQ